MILRWPRVELIFGTKKNLSFRVFFLVHLMLWFANEYCSNRKPCELHHLFEVKWWHWWTTYGYFVMNAQWTMLISLGGHSRPHIWLYGVYVCVNYAYGKIKCQASKFMRRNEKLKTKITWVPNEIYLNCVQNFSHSFFYFVLCVMTNQSSI